MFCSSATIHVSLFTGLPFSAINADEEDTHTNLHATAFRMSMLTDTNTRAHTHISRTGAPNWSRSQQQTAPAAGDRARGEQTATAPPSRTAIAAGRGGGGRGVRRRRPGEGRGRGGNRGTNKQKAAFLRSRDFVLKVRGMSRWNWRGVLEELEAAEEAEARLGEVRRGGGRKLVAAARHTDCTRVWR